MGIFLAERKNPKNLGFLPKQDKCEEWVSFGHTQKGQDPREFGVKMFCNCVDNWYWLGVALITADQKGLKSSQTALHLQLWAQSTAGNIFSKIENTLF